jgi:hypothetical protein
MVILKRSSRIPEKECSIYLTINEMQKEMTLTFHLTPVRIAFINSTHNNRCWKKRMLGKRNVYTPLVGM